MKKKRQRTRWIFTALLAENTYQRIGVIHNKHKGNLYDIIRVQIKSKTDFIDFLCRIDEAQMFAFGLNKVLTHIIMGFQPGLKEYMGEYIK